MSEAGEGSTSASVTIDPDKYLNAEVVEVSFDKSFKACREKTTITAPHWPAGAADGHRQSKKAAVLQLGKKNSCTATVKVQVDSKGYSGNGVLKGTLNDLVFEGDIPLASGNHEVSVTLKEIPEALSWIKGKMLWEITSSEVGTVAGTTPLELFFVFEDPSKMKFFKKKGVWIEALRFIFEKANLNGTKKVEDGLKKVTKCCFELPWHQYEIEGGASIFGGMTGRFLLADYMKPQYSQLNCYDQAYAVITFGGALGLAVDGLFLKPFGFLKYTNLVGRGPCNNPFPYSKQQGELANRSLLRRIVPKKNTKLDDYLVVDTNDKYRMGFGNHMFCEFNGKVFDACAGATLGEHDRLGYVLNGIDIEPDIPLNIVRYDRGNSEPHKMSVSETKFPNNEHKLTVYGKKFIEVIKDTYMDFDSVL